MRYLHGMPKRDGHIPTDTELDALARVTDDDIEDGVRTFKQRVPAARPAIDAERNDAGARGPIPDEQ